MGSPKRREHTRPMQPARIERLRWLQPIDIPDDKFAQLRPVLSALLSEAQENEIYSVNTRSIYRVDDPLLGPVAIKELRFEGAYQQFRAAFLRRHRVLCEFRAGGCFGSRGGPTPGFLGVALEPSRVGFSRVFLILRWLRDARTLTQVVETWEDSAPTEKLAELASVLVLSAECGLEHGRHSSENILLDAHGNFFVIDFSHGQITRGFPASGLVLDAARIGARLILSNACSRQTVMRLFDEILRVGHPRVNSVLRARMEAECDHILVISKRRRRLERRFRTVLRGLSMRLNA